MRVKALLGCGKKCDENIKVTIGATVQHPFFTCPGRPVASTCSSSRHRIDSRPQPTHRLSQVFAVSHGTLAIPAAREVISRRIRHPSLAIRDLARCLPPWKRAGSPLSNHPAN